MTEPHEKEHTRAPSSAERIRGLLVEKIANCVVCNSCDGLGYWYDSVYGISLCASCDGVGVVIDPTIRGAVDESPLTTYEKEHAKVLALQILIQEIDESLQEYFRADYPAHILLKWMTNRLNQSKSLWSDGE